MECFVFGEREREKKSFSPQRILKYKQCLFNKDGDLSCSQCCTWCVHTVVIGQRICSQSIWFLSLTTSSHVAGEPHLGAGLVIQTRIQLPFICQRLQR